MKPKPDTPWKRRKPVKKGGTTSDPYSPFGAAFLAKWNEFPLELESGGIFQVTVFDKDPDRIDVTLRGGEGTFEFVS